MDKDIVGFDLARDITSKLDVFIQVLSNTWKGFDASQPDKNFSWVGGFIGVDYIHSQEWAFSFLQNYADNGDFSDSDSIFRGIEINTTTLSASYYLARNAKLLFEVNIDWLDIDRDTLDRTYGHQVKENTLVFGVDAAF